MSEKITNVSQVKDTDSLIKFIESKGENKKISEQELQIIINNESVRFTLSLALEVINRTGMSNDKNDYIFRLDFSKFNGRFCGDDGNGKLVDCRYLESKLRDEDDNTGNYDTQKRKYFMLIYMFAQSLDGKNLGYLDEEQYQEISDTIARSLNIEDNNKYAQHILKIFGADTIKKDFFDKIFDKYNGPTDKEFVGNVFRTYGDKFDANGFKKIFGDNGDKINFDIDLINPESELSLYQICLKCQEKAIAGELADKIISKIQTGKFKLTQQQQESILSAFDEDKRDTVKNKLGKPFSLDGKEYKKESGVEKNFLEAYKEKDKDKKDWANFKAAVEELNKNICVDLDTALKIFELCPDVYLTDKKVNEKNEELKLAELDSFHELKDLKINYYKSDSPKKIYDNFIVSISESGKKLTTDKLKFIAFERSRGNAYFDSNELREILNNKLSKGEMESADVEGKKDKVDDKFLYWLGAVFGENKINKEAAKICADKFDGQFNQFTFAKFANLLEDGEIDKAMAEKLFYKDNKYTFDVLNGPQIMLGIKEDNYDSIKKKFDNEGLKVFDNAIKEKRGFDYEDINRYVDFIFSNQIENYYGEDGKPTEDSKKFEGLAKYFGGLKGQNKPAAEFFSRIETELGEMLERISNVQSQDNETIDIEIEKNKLHYVIDLYPNLTADQKKEWHENVKKADEVNLGGIILQFIRTVAKMALYLPFCSGIREEGHSEWKQGLGVTGKRRRALSIVKEAQKKVQENETKYKPKEKDNLAK